jgi:ubiquinone/menaquinone biosynthesis C-methylase UbiE
MKYQAKIQEEASTNELLQSEADEHDELYTGAYPFWGDTLEVDVEEVERIYDVCYKPGTNRNGKRKRRLLELLDVDNVDGKKILDVGCGNGQHSVYLAMKGANVWGFDISRQGLAMADRVAEANDVAERCEFSIQTASDMAYRSDEFDIVLCSSVLHHIWKYDGVQDELYRVLRPGGALVFDDGMRSNELYTTLRDAYRKVTNQTQDLGDVDVEYRDLVSYGERFSRTHMEFYTPVSGFVKNIVAEDCANPPHLRHLFRVLRVFDSIVEKFEFADPYCLDVVGRFEK